MKKERKDLTTIKIKITTPKGEAKKAEWRLRPFILGTFTKVKEWYISPEDDEIVWIVQCDVRRSIKINTNVSAYADAVKWGFNSKPVKWYRKKFTEEQQQEVKEMLENGTKIEILKMASVKAWEDSQKPLWKRVKDKVFK